MRRLLVAGIGNIFLGDDGFGVEVARRLSAEKLPEEVQVSDFGIRGLHLAYELLDGRFATTILVDATRRGGAAGTLYLIEPEMQNLDAAPADAHAMDPQAVLVALKTMGGNPGRVLIVGCEPACLDEGIGLSPAVTQAVDEAVRFVQELIAREQGD